MTRLQHDRAMTDVPSIIPDEISFIDALLALPAAHPEEHGTDAVDRAVNERLQLALARKLRDVLDGKTGSE